MTSSEAPAPVTAGNAGTLPFDTSIANQARIYDYVLGGKDNYAADRAATEALLRIDPEVPFTMRSNRAFLGRSVRYLAAEAGIRQFLDIGTGIPTAGNTHQVAQAVAPESRVVYVDYDPIVLAHARALLTSHEAGATEYIDADFRDPGTILDQAADLLDFNRPVAFTMLGLLHVIPDSDNPGAILARLLNAVPAGSYLVISHLGSDLIDQDKLDGIMNVADRMIQQRPVYRSREQVARFFDGTDLVEPGLVRVEEWRQESSPDRPARSSLWCGVGRKR
jgi:O-methyltransferase involved in polyketide biosynthesis